MALELGEAVAERALLDFWGQEAANAPNEPQDRRDAVAQLQALMANGFTPDEAALLSSVEDLLAAGVRAAAARGPALGCDLAESGAAVVVLGPEGQLWESTARAAAYLDELRCGPGQDVPVLVRMVAEACRLRSEGYDVLPSARVRTSAGRWLLVSAAELRGGPGPARMAVTFEPADIRHTLDLALDLYDVTERERVVARQVVEGASTATIAASLSISAYTVQDHLKSIFAKVGVSSRRELVRVLTRC